MDIDRQDRFDLVGQIGGGKGLQDELAAQLAQQSGRRRKFAETAGEQDPRPTVRLHQAREKAVEAVYLAAKIAKKDMKDLQTEIKMYDRIAAEYPQDPQAPKAMFAAAEAYENAKDFDKAKEYYGKISDQYSQDPLAAKAQKRVNAIINK